MHEKAADEIVILFDAILLFLSLKFSTVEAGILSISTP